MKDVARSTQADSRNAVLKCNKMVGRCEKAVFSRAITGVVGVLRMGLEPHSTTEAVGDVGQEGASSENGTPEVD